MQMHTLFSWLGMRDSNPRMLVPETSALPLGESPVGSLVGTFIILAYLVAMLLLMLQLSYE